MLKKSVRLNRYDEITPLKELKANLMGKCCSFACGLVSILYSAQFFFNTFPFHLGRFISIRGTVVRVSSIKPILSNLAFICNTCMAEQSCPQADGKYKQPTKCTSAGCRGKSFSANRASSLTETKDWQRIRWGFLFKGFCFPLTAREGRLVTYSGSF